MQESQGTVIKATAHTDTVPVYIKPDQRHQHQIQLPGINQAARPGYGLEDAEAIYHEFAVTGNWRKPQAFASEVGQDGHVALFTGLPDLLDHRISGDFAVCGKVAGDAIAGTKITGAANLSRNATCSESLLPGGEVSSRGTKLLS